MSVAKTHVVAALLAILTTLPYPGIRGGPKDPLESTGWLSYNFLDGSVTQPAKAQESSANSLWAGFFVAYVVRSAWTTFRQSIRLALASQKIPDANYPVKASFFGCMSFMVFITLSLQLMLFAIGDYMSWSNSPLRTKVEPSFPLRVWQWLLTSRPFLDFARSIFATNGGYWWSAQSLLSSLVTNFWMSAAAQLHDIPNLTDYFFLGQLLPPSFSQCLFFVALLLRPFSKEPNSTKPRVTRFYGESTGWFFLVFFRLLVSYLPLATSPSWRLIMAILLTRLMLFSPYFLLFDSPATIEAAFPWVMIYRLPLLGVNFFTTSPGQITSAMTSNFAVSSLGIDLLFSIANTTVFFLWRVASEKIDDGTKRKMGQQRQQQQQ